MPKKIASTLGMSRDEWLHIRRGYLGGSDAAVCMDANPWSDKLSLYCDKKELRPDQEDNFRMKLGRDLEDLVARYFMEETGKKVRNDNSMWISDEYSFMGADIDRTVVGENAALECKTTSSLDLDIEGGDIPEQYYWQIQHYMEVMGYDYMYLAFLQFGKGFYWFKIDRNEADIRRLIDAEKDFWTNYIMIDQRPDADGSESSLETLSMLYPKDSGRGLEMSPREDYWCQKYMEYGDSIKRLKDLQGECKARLQETLREHAYGESPLYKVTWKNQEKKSVDFKRLEDELNAIGRGDIILKTIKVSNSRVMRFFKRKPKKGDK